MPLCLAVINSLILMEDNNKAVFIGNIKLILVNYIKILKIFINIDNLSKKLIKIHK